MSDTETRMMRYTIEQLSAELQATRQYVSDIKSKLERTRKALEIAVDALDRMAINDSIYDIIARNAMKRIKELEQKDHFANASKKVEQKDNGGNK